MCNRVNKSDHLGELKRCLDFNPNSPYFRLYGTKLDRDDCIEIDRNRINNL